LNLEHLEPRLALTVIINEFLAENDTGIRDAAGHRHDWIELKNTGGATENIAGWYLTDDAGDLTKFQIPSAGALTTLDPGEILLVYASGNNGEVGLVGSELHTNFKMSQEPAYLALVQSNGTTIEDAFNLYPQQTPDVSYGTGITVGTQPAVTLVDGSTDVSYLVPTSENAATDDFWREPGFNTAGWGTGTGGVGKDLNADSPNFNTEGWIGTNIASEMSNTERTAYIRYEFDVSNPEQLTSLSLALRMDDGFIVYLNGREMARANFGEDFAQPQPMWNSNAGNLTTSSSANANHVGTEVATPLQFDFTPYLQYLVDDGIADGNDNLLAFHGVNTGSSNTASLQDFLIQPVLTAERANGSSQVGYMAAPSPGRENGVSSLGYIEDTVFSHDRGFYDTAFSLEITTPSTAGTSIYYTTDGTIPTETVTATNKLYTGPISIDPSSITSGERGVVMIRAKAFKTDFISTNVDTQTYVFLDKVIEQDGSGLEAYETWGRDDGDGNGNGYNGDDESDWEMDPSIVTGNETAVKNALTSIPTMSLVMDWDDLFGGDPQLGTPLSTNSNVNPATQGIYIVGSSSERQASLEFFDPDVASDQFQVDTLVEVQGHSSTLRWRSDKLSLQVKFKNPLADPELDYPLFDGSPDGESATTQFDTFILDAGYNWWWHNNNPAQAADARFVPDQVMADLQNAASGVGGVHGKFVHLYLNGLYWGVYYAHERPDDSFAAEYYGGDKDDYYAIKHASDDIDHNYSWADGGVNAELAYEALLDAARAVGSSPGNMALYGNVEDILDVDQFIDYMIVHFYGGNENDWPHNNWYATFNHVDPAGKWRFHAWDQEHAFSTPTADPTDYNSGDDFESPFEIFDNLIDNDEFRLKFADRTQALLFDGGALTETNAQATYEARVNEIFEALIGESARWGDNREDATGTTFDQSDFNANKNSLIAGFFPVRSDLFAGDDLGPGSDNWNENGSFFENRSWLVALEAPEFSLSGNMLTLTDPQSSGGTIWYTLDGTDPRDRNTNNQSGTAFQYVAPIALSGSTQVRARIDDGSSGTVDDWSALADDTFFIASLDPSDLRIVEMMYNPNAADGDTEYIELLNTGTTTLDLTGVRLADFSSGGYTFTGGMLSAGERIVVVGNQTDFGIKYPSVTNVVAGEFGGSLSNGGETVALFGPGDVLLQRFDYTDDPPWPTTPDGTGYSLVYVGPFDAGEDPSDGDPDDPFDVGSNWAASADLGGSPGQAEPTGGILYGDYNGNSVVDAADYSVWRDALTAASTTLLNDITPGVVDESDFLYWRSHFGETLGSGAGSGAAAVAAAEDDAEEAAPIQVAVAVVQSSSPVVEVQTLSEPVGPQLTEPAAGLGASVALVVPSHTRIGRHVQSFVHQDGQRDIQPNGRLTSLLLNSLRGRDVRETVDAALGSSGPWHRWHRDDDGLDDEVLAEAGSVTGEEPSCRVWEDADWLQSLAHRRRV
jgi:hypothetical protein